MNRRRRTAGFGLLEAIVALTLLAGSGLALFAWINQNLQAASRVQQIEREARLLLTAQAVVESVNPLQQPAGAMEVSGLALQWQSTPVEPPRRNAAFGEGVAGPWMVGLFRLQVRAQDRARGTQIVFEQWRVGTLRLEPVSEELP